MIVDLTYLQGATDGNKELIAQLVGLFAEQVEEFSREMNESLQSRNSERMRKVAHKAKGSISALGMNEVRKLLQEMEDRCAEATKIEDVRVMQENVKVFISSCNQALIELNDYLKD